MADGDEQPDVPLKVFYSYSHVDAALREKLDDQLEPFRAKGLIEDWYDDRIVPGSNFNDVIRAKMDESDLIVLLVTAAFLNSSYIKQFELPRAYELEQSGRAVLLPILLRPVADWRNIPLFASRQSPLSGDTAVTQRRDKDTAFAKIAEGIARAAEDRRSKRPPTPPVVVSSPVTAPAVRVEFLYAPIETGLYDEIDRNPYKRSHNPDEPAEDSRVRAFLWLPPRAALKGDLPGFTTAAVVCDPGLPEITANTPGFEADLTRVGGYYQSSFADLKPEPLDDFAQVAGKILAGRFVAAIAVPRIMLGDRVEDVDFAYQILLNLIVWPLATGHARLRFGRFDLCLNRIDDPSSKKTPLEGHAKKLIKARFATGSYGVTTLSPTDPAYFSLHAARFVQWAAHRFFNDGNEDWLRKLRIAFETTEGLPEGSPSS